MFKGKKSNLSDIIMRLIPNYEIKKWSCEIKNSKLWSKSQNQEIHLGDKEACLWDNTLKLWDKKSK